MVSNTCMGKIKYTYCQTLDSRANKLHSFISCTRHRNLTNNLQCQENHFTRRKNTRGTDNSMKSEMNQITHRVQPAETIFLPQEKNMVLQKRKTPQDAANIPAKSNPSQAGNQAFHHPSQISMLEAPEI